MNTQRGSLREKVVALGCDNMIYRPPLKISIKKWNLKSLDYFHILVGDTNIHGISFRYYFIIYICNISFFQFIRSYFLVNTYSQQIFCLCNSMSFLHVLVKINDKFRCKRRFSLPGLWIWTWNLNSLTLAMKVRACEANLLWLFQQKLNYW